MNELSGVSRADQSRALWLSTIAFTLCFAVWTIFSIIGLSVKSELGLSEFEYGLLIATPVLTGSLSRLMLGIWTERFGGRVVFGVQMILAGMATWSLMWAHSYTTYLLAALGAGLAGGSFIIGVTYVTKWYPADRQGTALGVFGMGNVGAALTKFLAPFVLVMWGWEAVAQIWSVVIIATGVLYFLLAKDDPQFTERRARGIPTPSLAEQFAPLKKLQVWRFSLYYLFVFGGFMALALWLPYYLVEVYHVDIRTAGMAAAVFSLSASLFRAYGGMLSDRFGARTVMYWTFGFSAVLLFMLSYPPTDYVIRGKDGPIAFSTEMGLWPFVVTLFGLGFFMSLGKAAVFKHIPVYYPEHVGAVGGLVGMIGGLGGFVLPIVFGALLDVTGVWTSAFMLLLLIVIVSATWMNLSIRRMERATAGDALDRLPSFPELSEVHDPERTKMPRVIEDWRPEDADFWATKGRAIAKRNLWISIPALFLSFAVWMVWSVVIAKLPAIGFRFTQDQLFWLAALPALSGASLRIFYSFMVPIFGGRLWTTLDVTFLTDAIGGKIALFQPAQQISFEARRPDPATVKGHGDFEAESFKGCLDRMKDFSSAHGYPLLSDTVSWRRGRFQRVLSWSDASPTPELKLEATKILRGLISEVRMMPDASAPGGHHIELVGDLAGILALSEADMTKPPLFARAGSSSKSETMVAGAGSNLHLLPEQVKMVAGTGIDHNLQSTPVKMVAGGCNHHYLRPTNSHFPINAKSNAGRMVAKNSSFHSVLFRTAA